MFIASLLTVRPALQRSAMSPARDAQVEHVFAPLERGERFRDRAFHKHFVPTGRGVSRKLFLRKQELDLAYEQLQFCRRALISPTKLLPGDASLCKYSKIK